MGWAWWACGPEPRPSTSLFLSNNTKQVGFTGEPTPTMMTKDQHQDMSLWQLEVQLVLDGGYRIPGGYAGRVLTGRGTGTNLGTHVKPVPVGT